MLVVAAVCWGLFVTQGRVVPSRMGQLAVRRSGVPGLLARPATARTLPVSQSSITSVKTAARSRPAHTGIYEVGWQSPAKAATTTNAGLLLQLVPTTTLADKVLGTVRAQYAKSRSVSGDQYTLTSHFTVPGVPGAAGVVFHVTSGSAAASGTAYVVTFRVGQVVTLVLIQTTGTLPGGSRTAASLAHAEAARLDQVGTGFSLRVTSRPLGWSLALAGGAVAVAAAVIVLPEWLAGLPDRRRRRHEHRVRQRLEEERRARGRRAVRRHRPPAWQRPHGVGSGRR